MAAYSQTMRSTQVPSCQIGAPIAVRPRLLRAVLLANAAFSVLSGVFFLLAAKEITSLVVTGVTTEVCVHTTVREANDRGYECLVLEDCVGSYFPEFQRVGLAMIAAQGGIFGWVAPSASFLDALDSPGPAPAPPPSDLEGITS